MHLHRAARKYWAHCAPRITHSITRKFIPLLQRALHRHYVMEYYTQTILGVRIVCLLYTHTPYETALCWALWTNASELYGHVWNFDLQF